LAHAKVQKYSLLDCPRSLLVSGKQQFYFPPIASSTSELLLELGFMALDAFSTVGFPSLFPQPHPQVAFCTLSTVGALFPPLISTPLAPSSQVSEEIGVSKDSLT
jgi:hypothetical protein